MNGRDPHRLTTLRDVLARRELEQELAIVDAPLEELGVSRCRVCRGKLNSGWGEVRTVCSGCGGRRKQEQLEREDAAHEAEERRRRALVSVVFPHHHQEQPMDEKKLCTKCGAKELRVTNTTGVCTPCRKAMPAGERPAASGAKASPGNKALRKNFQVLAEALGEDPDELVACFMEGWIEKARAAVKRATEEL